MAPIRKSRKKKSSNAALTLNVMNRRFEYHYPYLSIIINDMTSGNAFSLVAFYISTAKQDNNDTFIGIRNQTATSKEMGGKTREG